MATNPGASGVYSVFNNSGNNNIRGGNFVAHQEFNSTAGYTDQSRNVQVSGSDSVTISQGDGAVHQSTVSGQVATIMADTERGKRLPAPADEFGKENQLAISANCAPGSSPTASEQFMDQQFDDDRVEEYDLGFPKRGKAIIISLSQFRNSKNNVRGVARDGEALRQFFAECRFEIDPTFIGAGQNQQNFTASVIMDHLKGEAQKDYSEYALLVCAVVSHGGICDNRCYIEDYNEEPMYTERIVDLFKGNRSLAGKPKVFIFHACRGTQEEQLMPVPGASQPPQYSAPQFTTYAADFLIFYSTVKGHLSYFKRDAMSVFVRTLLDCLRNSSRDVLSVFTKVIREVIQEVASRRNGDEVITPCFESTLTKALKISFFLS